jgi:hypothetical protein
MGQKNLSAVVAMRRHSSSSQRVSSRADKAGAARRLQKCNCRYEIRWPPSLPGGHACFTAAQEGAYEEAEVKMEPQLEGLSSGCDGVVVVVVAVSRGLGLVQDP